MEKSKVFLPKKPVKKLTLKKNTTTIAVDNKIKNVMELPDDEENKVKNVTEPQEFDLLSGLPYEILLKIMEYLSTSDILKRMAHVSKSFYQLSQDQNIIKQMDFKTIEFTSRWIKSWTDERKKKYYDDFFKVLKNSQKLKFLSIDFDLDQQMVGNFYRNWIESSVNLQYLEEFYIKISDIELESCTDFLQYGVFDRCPKLKIFRIRRHHFVHHNFETLNTIASFNSKSLEKLYLYSPNTDRNSITYPYDDPLIIKNFLKMMTENMPKIQYLLLNPPGNFHANGHFNGNYKVSQEIAAEKKIKIEIWDEPNGINFVFSPL